MSERLITANKRLYDAFEPGMEHTVPPLLLVREAVSLLGWGTMAYRCDLCEFEWDIWLSLGVEGPPSLREHNLYVASPFTLSSCPAWPGMGACAGRMAHVRFRDDKVFSPRLIPDDAPRFVLDHWHESAGLVLPTPALVRARRFHNEPSES